MTNSNLLGADKPVGYTADAVDVRYAGILAVLSGVRYMRAVYADRLAMVEEDDRSVLRWVRPADEAPTGAGRKPLVDQYGNRASRIIVGCSAAEWKASVESGIYRPALYTDAEPAGTPVGGGDESPAGLAYVDAAIDRIVRLGTLAHRASGMVGGRSEAALKAAMMGARGVQSALARNPLTASVYADCKLPNPNAYLSDLTAFQRAAREARGHWQTGATMGSGTRQDGGKVYRRAGVDGTTRYVRGSRVGTDARSTVTIPAADTLGIMVEQETIDPVGDIATIMADDDGRDEN